jgi:hypothetical protein
VLEYLAPDVLGPLALVAELLTPGPQAPRQVVQLVLVRESDGSVHLMGDGRDAPAGFARPALGGRHREACLASIERRSGRVGRRFRCGDFAGHAGKLLLHGLKAADRPAELNALACVVDRDLEGLFERPADQCCPPQRSERR